MKENREPLVLLGDRNEKNTYIFTVEVEYVFV